MIGDICEYCTRIFTQGCVGCIEYYKKMVVDRLKKAIRTEENPIRYKYIINRKYAVEIIETLNKKGNNIKILDYKIEDIIEEGTIMIEVDKKSTRWQEDLTDYINKRKQEKR